MIAIALGLLGLVVMIATGVAASSTGGDHLTFLGVQVQTTTAQVFMTGAIFGWVFVAALWLLRMGIHRSGERCAQLAARRSRRTSAWLGFGEEDDGDDWGGWDDWGGARRETGFGAGEVRGRGDPGSGGWSRSTPTSEVGAERVVGRGEALGRADARSQGGALGIEVGGARSWPGSTDVGGTHAEAGSGWGDARGIEVGGAWSWAASIDARRTQPEAGSGWGDAHGTEADGAWSWPASTDAGSTQPERTAGRAGGRGHVEARGVKAGGIWPRSVPVDAGTVQRDETGGWGDAGSAQPERIVGRPGAARHPRGTPGRADAGGDQAYRAGAGAAEQPGAVGGGHAAGPGAGVLPSLPSFSDLPGAGVGGGAQGGEVGGGSGAVAREDCGSESDGCCGEGRQ